LYDINKEIIWEVRAMTFAVTQSDFREHIKDYFDRVNDDNETVYVTRSNSRTVAVISQEKLNWMEMMIKSLETSADYAISRDQLIKSGVIPEESDLIEPGSKAWDNYWGKF
jgi:prevent-host-death family protein